MHLHPTVAVEIRLMHAHYFTYLLKRVHMLIYGFVYTQSFSQHKNWAIQLKNVFNFSQYLIIIDHLI